MSVPTLVQSVDWAAVSPAAGLALAGVVVLVVDLFLTGSSRRVHLVDVSVLAALASIGGWSTLAATGARSTFCLAAARLPHSGLAVGRSCSYVADPYADFFAVLVLVALVVVLLLLRPAVAAGRLPAGETCFLLLACVSGMVTLAASRDLVSLVVSLEVVSLPAFVLVGLRRSDPRSAQAALTFFLVSVVSTALSLYGMALLYGLTGSVQLDRIGVGLAAVRSGGSHADGALAAAAVVLVVAGFVFKVAAVPFHAWAPDTYQGATGTGAALLSAASKAAGFAGLLQLLLGPLRPYADVWGPVVAVVAALTMTVGNLVALRQSNVVRLLAWSTVAQGGYLLMPLGVAITAPGRTPAALHAAESATLAYLAIYAVVNLGAFAVVVAIGARGGFALRDYRGLAARSPWLAAALVLFLTALAGLPPGVCGLVAKVVVLRATVDGHATWLAVVASVNTVIGLAYYLRLAAAPFTGLGEPATADADPAAAPRPRTARPVALALSLAATGAVVLSVAAQPLLHAADIASRT